MYPGFRGAELACSVAIGGEEWGDRSCIPFRYLSGAHDLLPNTILPTFCKGHCNLRRLDTLNQNPIFLRSVRGEGNLKTCLRNQ